MIPSIGLAVFSLAILLPGLGSHPSLTHYMEYAYSVPIPLEMREHAEYLTPLLAGEPHLLKPPLLWWMILLSYKIFGVSLWSMRLPSTLCTAATVVTTLHLGKTLGLKTRESLAASFLTLTSVGLFGIGRMGLIDGPLTFSMVLAFDGLCQWLLQKKTAGLTLCGITSGLSMMLKWPVAPAVVGLSILGWLLWEKDWTCIKQARWQGLRAMALALMVAAPWNAAMAHRYGSDYWTTVFLGELFSVRFIASPNIPLSTFITQCLVATAPWTLLIFAVMLQPRKIFPPPSMGEDSGGGSKSVRGHPPILTFPHGGGKESKLSREDRLILIWTIASVFPFAIQKTKTERYVLFIVPALLIWTLRHFDWEAPLHRWMARLTSGLTFFSALAIFGLGLWFRLGTTLCLTGILCAGLAAWGLAMREDLILAGMGVGGILVAAFGFLLPSLNPSPHPAGEGSQPKTCIFCPSHDLAYLPLHMGRNLPDIEDLSMLRSALAKNYAVATSETYLPKLKTLVDTVGGIRLKTTSEWMSFNPPQAGRDLLYRSFSQRNLSFFTQKNYILSPQRKPPYEQSPKGNSIANPASEFSLLPGTYLMTALADCPEGIAKARGVRKMGWVNPISTMHGVEAGGAVYKKDLLFSEPYWYTWPLRVSVPDTFHISMGSYPPNPSLRLRGLWIQPISQGVYEKLIS